MSITHLERAQLTLHHSGGYTEVVTLGQVELQVEVVLNFGHRLRTEVQRTNVEFLVQLEFSRGDYYKKKSGTMPKPVSKKTL